MFSLNKDINKFHMNVSNVLHNSVLTHLLPQLVMSYIANLYQLPMSLTVC